MKGLKFSDSLIVEAVNLIEVGWGVPDICRELGISTATFNKWRDKYGRMDVSFMSRMKELEEENRRLMKMYLEEKLKAEIVSEVLKNCGGVIMQTGDDLEGGHITRCLHSGSLPNVSTSANLTKREDSHGAIASLVRILPFLPPHRSLSCAPTTLFRLEKLVNCT